ncbi:MAG TPA: cysteine desulfurase [Salinisphaeraceae bacterium]|nr:cysteine desulfurase [Salinisphaeraceae bacterium]
MMQVQAHNTMAPAFDAERMRADFPVLGETLPGGRRLVYLDNAATTQKPNAVIEALDAYYRHANANVHRAIHTLSQRATQQYEAARDSIATFINAASREEIIFTRGTTDSINLVAATYGASKLKAGDEVLITGLEHHSNIVPWQLVCERTGASLVVVPVNDAGEVSADDFAARLSERTRIAAFGHISNALGTILPIEEMIAHAHAADVPVLIDGAQAIAHTPVDVQALDADFYAFSGHKMFGPTGIGVLYGKAELLDAMPPWQGGGDMIETVTFDGSTWNTLPYKFEAGTPNIAGAVGLGAAVEYLRQFDLAAIAAHEHELLLSATNAVRDIPGLRIIGTARHKAATLSLVMEQAHAQDIGTLLDETGVAVRTGHHCAMPLMQHFGISATARASFAAYNTMDDVTALVEGLHSVQRVFS